jgi:hypothetical protein
MQMKVTKKGELKASSSCNAVSLSWMRQLQRCQLELDEATRRLARADQDFSVVRGLIQWAGYPPFPIEAKVISMTIRVVPVGVYNLFAVEAATYHDELVPRIVSYKSCCRLSVFP